MAPIVVVVLGLALVLALRSYNSREDGTSRDYMVFCFVLLFISAVLIALS